MLLLVLLALFVVSPIITLPSPAKADVPGRSGYTDDLGGKEVGGRPLSVVTNLGTALTSNDYWADLTGKELIKILQGIAIDYIKTGRFGGPSFSLSYILDPQKSAENAAKMFLSELTGVNFCNGFPNFNFYIKGLSSINLNLNLTLECTFTGGDLTSLYQGTNGNIVDLWAAQSTENDPFNSQVDALDQKIVLEERALYAKKDETLAGRGFLGLRKSDGTISTPGEIIAEPLRQGIKSDFSNVELIDELTEAMANVTAMLINTLFEDAITGGLQ